MSNAEGEGAVLWHQDRGLLGGEDGEDRAKGQHQGGRVLSGGGSILTSASCSGDHLITLLVVAEATAWAKLVGCTFLRTSTGRLLSWIEPSWLRPPFRGFCRAVVALGYKLEEGEQEQS